MREREQLYVPLRVGQKVGEFTVATYNPVQGGFDQFSFAEFSEKKAWLVLFFYPSDFTFVCPTELAALSQIHQKLIECSVEVLSVSTDTKFSHMVWQNSERLLDDVRFSMGADPTGALCRYFGVYDENEGTALRGTFIISPDGILVSSEINYYNVGRNQDELLRKIHANTYLQAHPDEVCPSGWEEGDPTLKPSDDIVGKVFEVLHNKERV